jgi:uncharacterized protein (TIGR00266 family)
MAHQIDYKIHGDDLQAVEITLDPGEAARAEAGTMMYMDMGIEMQTNMEGGVFGGLKRVFTGESFFITNFLNRANQAQTVTFAAPYPGKVLPINLAQTNGVFICQKDSFLCAASGIDVGIAFTKRLGAGLFGGEGFILQKLTGDGLAFVHAGGTIIKRELNPGQSLHVDTGCIVGFTQDVDYNIRFVGGFKNTLFGGEGLFLATLTGPGTVYLQSLPLSKLADRIIASKTVGNNADSSGFGQLLGGIISGD